MNPTNINFTPSQATALEHLLGASENIFLTGGPGTGKSFLIREFRKLKEGDEIPVIASTGAAAILVGGRTFHSFFGLGIMQGGPQVVLKKALKNSRLRRRIRDLSTIIIDEVSMLSWEVFDTAEAIARSVRKSNQPWGGIRVIAVGDFAQLPPISQNNEKQWCFLGDGWRRSEFHKVVLEEVKRSEDAAFLNILEDIRWGNLSSRVEDFLNDRIVEGEMESDVPHIFPRRHQTESYNKVRLAESKHTLKEYKTEYGGDNRYVERLKKDAPIPPILQLKKDALVMIRMNDPKQRYVNGTVGTICDLDEDYILVDIGRKKIEIEPFTFNVLDADGEEVAYAINFPLSLAYANTIHKMQGATLDRVHVDLKALWEPGQAYVALSRARSGKAVTLIGWEKRSIIADKHVQTFYDNQPTLENIE